MKTHGPKFVAAQLCDQVELLEAASQLLRFMPGKSGDSRARRRTRERRAVALVLGQVTKLLETAEELRRLLRLNDRIESRARRPPNPIRPPDPQNRRLEVVPRDGATPQPKGA